MHKLLEEILHSHIQKKVRSRRSKILIKNTYPKQLQDMPVPCSCVVQRLDWDVMLTDAKAKFKAFCKFEEANILPNTDNFSFTCSGGMCKLG